jgi:cytochrome c oxidase subunit 2
MTAIQFDRKDPRMANTWVSVFDAASPQAETISNLFILVLAVCAAILAIVACTIAICLVRFRQRSESEEPPSYFGNRKLEVAWVAGPLLITTGLFALTAQGMQRSDPPAAEKPDLIIVGHQWWWEVRYPQTGVVTANEVHIDVGRKWLVRLESADVIHDFWVPALAPKRDAVPGRWNHIWLEANSVGRYPGTCAEYCGAQHAWMRFSVIAETPDVFAEWMHRQQAPPAVPVTETTRHGQQLFHEMTCANCHSIRGVTNEVSAGPDLTHLANRENLGAGVLPNRRANLFIWLKNPQAVKPTCLMPNMKLTDAQAGELADYLETLK